MENNKLVTSGEFGVFAPPKPKYKHIKVSALGSQDVRFNGKDGYGHFSIDGDNDKSRLEMTMQIIHVELIKCDTFYLFNEKFKKYSQMVELIFLDGEQKLSSMFIKTESMSNLLSVLRKLHFDQKNYKTETIKAKSVERTGDKGKYHAIEFAHEGSAKKEVISELIELCENDIDLLFIASRYRSGMVKMIPRDGDE